MVSLKVICICNFWATSKTPKAVFRQLSRIYQAVFGQFSGSRWAVVGQGSHQTVIGHTANTYSGMTAECQWINVISLMWDTWKNCNPGLQFFHVPHIREITLILCHSAVISLRWLTQLMVLGKSCVNQKSC